MIRRSTGVQTTIPATVIATSTSVHLTPIQHTGDRRMQTMLFRLPRKLLTTLNKYNGATVYSIWPQSLYPRLYPAPTISYQAQIPPLPALACWVLAK